MSDSLGVDENNQASLTGSPEQLSTDGSLTDVDSPDDDRKPNIAPQGTNHTAHDSEEEGSDDEDYDSEDGEDYDEDEDEDEDDEPEDALDIVPDSEPLRAGPSAKAPCRHRAVTQSPLKKPFRPLSPMSEHGSGDLVPDSLEVEESEADVPLAIEVASRNTKKSVAPTENVTVHGSKTRTASAPAPAMVICTTPSITTDLN